MINSKYIPFSYNVQRVDAKIRYYQVVIDHKIYKFPSVTTVLSYIKDSRIEDMKASMDPEMWEYVSKRGLSRGSVMHKYLENFLTKYQETKNKSAALFYTQTTTPIDTEVSSIYTDTNKFFVLGRDLFYNFWYQNWFDDVRDVVFLEMPLFSLKYKYAGSSDYAYINNNLQLVLGDFKSSTSEKSESEIQKYKTQISAYMQAFWEMYGIKPHIGEIKISHNNQVDTFHVKFEDRFDHLDEFITKSQMVHNKFQSILNL